MLQHLLNDKRLILFKYPSCLTKSIWIAARLHCWRYFIHTYLRIVFRCGRSHELVFKLGQAMRYRITFPTEKSPTNSRTTFEALCNSSVDLAEKRLRVHRMPFSPNINKVWQVSPKPVDTDMCFNLFPSWRCIH
jgi:hypothetical protein